MRNLSICSIFQNEAPFLKEWIEFHLLVGVEHFYLYNDRSTDNYQEILAPYIARGIVELSDCFPKNGERHFYNQRRAYARGLKAARGKSKWVAIIDLDEFIVPKNVDTITELLSPYEENLGVRIRWQKFGTSGYWELPEDKLMIECLTMASAVDYEDSFITKSIVQLRFLPDHFFDEDYVVAHTIDLIHFCEWEIYDGSKARIIGQISCGERVQESIDLSDAQINHYWCRNEKCYREEKGPRKARLHHEDFGTPLAWPEERFLKYINLYNIRLDETIQRFIPHLKVQINKELERDCQDQLVFSTF